MARQEPVSIVDRQDARSDRLPEGAARREQRRSQRADREPDGARLGGARLRGARARGVARRLRRSPVAALGGRRGIRQPRGARLADDDARRQGARVPGGDHRRPGRGPVSALARRRGRGRDRRRAAALLRRHDARAVEPGADERRAAPRVRRVSVDRAVTLPRRDSGRAGRAHRAGLQLRVPERVQPQPLRVPHQPVRAKGPRAGARSRGVLRLRERGSVGVRPAHRDAGAPRAVRRRHRHGRRGAQRRPEGHRALQRRSA